MVTPWVVGLMMFIISIVVRHFRFLNSYEVVDDLIVDASACSGAPSTPRQFDWGKMVHIVISEIPICASQYQIENSR